MTTLPSDWANCKRITTCATAMLQQELSKYSLVSVLSWLVNSLPNSLFVLSPGHICNYSLSLKYLINMHDTATESRKHCRSNSQTSLCKRNDAVMPSFQSTLVALAPLMDSPIELRAVMCRRPKLPRWQLLTSWTPNITFLHPACSTPPAELLYKWFDENSLM